MIEPADAPDLAAILAARGDPMAACELPWLSEFKELPENASPPLAMSGPHPRAVGSYGPECIKWAKKELKLTLRWWQALAITRQLEHDEDGALVWREIIESGPRRIGKSTRLRTTATWRVTNADLFLETQLAMLVSKDLAVGKEIHRGSWRWVEERKKRDPQAGWNVLRLGGAQEIEAPGGSRWLLRAPDAAYGYDVGYGQVDESWGVDPQAITDGLEPALLERHSPQLHLTSTAHVKASSLMRRRLVAALRNADEDVLLLLWGAPPGADYADENVWRAASPHWSEDRRNLMARKYAAALAGQDEPEFDDPDPVRGWAAQYLNVWPLLLNSASPLALPHWPSCAVTTPPPRPVALGVAVDLDRVWASLGAVGMGEKPHLGSVLRVRLAQQREAFVAEAARISREHGIPVALVAKGPAGTLEQELRDAGADVRTVTHDEYVQACAALFDAVESAEVTHGAYADLDAAVESAAWNAGTRRVWSWKTGDVSSLEAVTVALRAATHTVQYDLLESVY